MISFIYRAIESDAFHVSYLHSQAIRFSEASGACPGTHIRMKDRP